MKRFSRLIIAVLFYFSSIIVSSCEVYADNIIKKESEINSVIKSDTIRNLPAVSVNTNKERVSKNYLKTSYELSNYDLWLSADDLYENGNIYFNPLLPGPLEIQQHCQLDINNDGLEDLFYYDSYLLEDPIPNPPPRVFMNRGEIVERVNWTGPSIINPHGAKLLVGDFNNDSFPDIFTIVGFDIPDTTPFSELGKQISHLIFNSPNGFNRVTEFVDQPGFHHTGCSGDIDNDGDLDVIMLNFHYYLNNVSSKILWNDGQGNFTYGTSGFSEIAPINHAELYDVNNDGFLDFVFSYPANHLKQTNDMIIMWGNGKDFSLNNSTSFEYPVNLELADIDFWDINNDGISEIILSGTDVLLGTSPETGLKMFIDLYQSDDKGKTFIKKTNQYFDITNLPALGHLVVKDLDKNNLLDIYTSNRKDSVRWEWNGSKFINKFPLPKTPVLTKLSFTDSGKVKINWEYENNTSNYYKRCANWVIYCSNQPISDTNPAINTLIVPVNDTEYAPTLNEWEMDATSNEIYIRIASIDHVGIKSKKSNEIKITILPPTITSASVCEGTNLTIHGSNFTGVKELSINNSPISNFTILTPSTINATILEGQAGNVMVSTVAGIATSSELKNIHSPSSPLVIKGNKNVYSGNVETFSVPEVENVNFDWIFPNGWEKIAGNNSNSVTVKVGTTDGIITVNPSVYCGELYSVSLPVKVYTYIPDDNFQRTLKNLGIDKENKPDSILTDAILNVSELDLSSMDISDLTGIQDFANLRILKCSSNKLKDLNITGNKLLEELYCGNNDLTSIDLTKNTELKILTCEWSQIMTLNTSQNTKLNVLGCDGIPITSLDVTNNKELTLLSIYGQDIKTINLTNNTNLTYFSSVDCRLTELDVSKNLNLGLLNCSGNLLSRIDVSKNPALTFFGCSNNKLVYLNMKNGNNNILKTFSANNNPNLTCISVDDPKLAISYPDWVKDMTASYSDYCNPTASEFNELNKSVVVKPNPSKGFFRIEGLSANQQNRILVYNIYGGLIREQISNSTTETIDLNDQNSGVYLLFINGQHFKILKE